MSMREAAALIDGDSLEFESDYDGWDADMIHGCVCDDGWEGYDCSLRYLLFFKDLLTYQA